MGDDVAQVELPLEGSVVFLQAAYVDRGRVAADADGVDVLPVEPPVVAQLQRRVDGGEGVTAAAVVLKGHAGDVVGLAKPVGGLRPVAVLAHRHAVTDLALEDVLRAHRAALGGERREDPGVGSMRAVHRLGMGERTERLLQPRRHGGAGGDGVGELLLVQLQHGGHGRRGTEGAVGRGHMPVLVMRTPHHAGDAGGDLVTDDNRAQEILARQVVRLRRGERGGDHWRAGMVDRVAEDVVELDGMRGGGVDHRGATQRRGPARREQARLAPADVVDQRLDQSGRRLLDTARRGGRTPVDDSPLGVVEHFVRQRPLPLRDGVLGDFLDQHRILPQMPPEPVDRPRRMRLARTASRTGPDRSSHR